MKVFTIVCGLALSLGFSLFGMAFTQGIKKGWLRAIIAIILSLAMGFGCLGLFEMEYNSDEALYNNGVHADCGGEWDFVSVTSSKHGSKTYYYECDDCGAVIGIHHTGHKN